jgi:hypothetical protein
MPRRLRDEFEKRQCRVLGVETALGAVRVGVVLLALSQRLIVAGDEAGGDRILRRGGELQTEGDLILGASQIRSSVLSEAKNDSAHSAQGRRVGCLDKPARLEEEKMSEAGISQTSWSP